MDSLFFLVNPKQQTIQQASNFKTALELTFGSNITNIKESFEKDSKSKVFFDTGGIESNYFFRFIDILPRLKAGDSYGATHELPHE